MDKYCLMHSTHNTLDILQTGYLYTLEKLQNDDPNFYVGNAHIDKLPYIYMTLMKKENIKVMESINHSFCYDNMYLIFDSKLLMDNKFNINSHWYGGPDKDQQIIDTNNETDLLKIIEPYSHYLKNECLFFNKISIKKYLKEIHIYIDYFTKRKDIIHLKEFRDIIKLINEKYRNVSINIINSKKSSKKNYWYYYFNNNPI
uniref:Uncharacterized protein n=1 Tax=viral metagenome TaxID=1070528 RepID=A0A6C0H5I4_9ZZZZ